MHWAIFLLPPVVAGAGAKGWSRWHQAGCAGVFVPVIAIIIATLLLGTQLTPRLL